MGFKCEQCYPSRAGVRLRREAIGQGCEEVNYLAEPDEASRDPVWKVNSPRRYLQGKRFRATRISELSSPDVNKYFDSPRVCRLNVLWCFEIPRTPTQAELEAIFLTVVSLPNSTS